ncbi:hypothetical protein VTI28DRAFT_7636 [Corynascus sepedonium]
MAARCSALQVQVQVQKCRGAEGSPHSSAHPTMLLAASRPPHMMPVLQGGQPQRQMTRSRREAEQRGAHSGSCISPVLVWPEPPQNLEGAGRFPWGKRAPISKLPGPIDE